MARRVGPETLLGAWNHCDAMWASWPLPTRWWVERPWPWSAGYPGFRREVGELVFADYLGLHDQPFFTRRCTPLLPIKTSPVNSLALVLFVFCGTCADVLGLFLAASRGPTCAQLSYLSTATTDRAHRKRLDMSLHRVYTQRPSIGAQSGSGECVVPARTNVSAFTRGTAGLGRGASQSDLPTA
jgi:hypothetical protein